METAVLDKTVKELSVEELDALLKQRKQDEAEKARKLKATYEVLKAETVLKLVPQANALSDALKDFKALAFKEMDALYDLLCQYSKRHKDGKGNFSLEIEEGMRVNYNLQSLGYFDERSSQAERHIIDFVNKQFSNDQRTKKLITSLLERKKGSLDIKLVQKLYAMENDFDDANWLEGIKLLKESWTPSESKAYIRFEVKKDGYWQPILLDFAKI